MAAGIGFGYVHRGNYGSEDQSSSRSRKRAPDQATIDRFLEREYHLMNNNDPVRRLTGESQTELLKRKFDRFLARVKVEQRKHKSSIANVTSIESVVVKFFESMFGEQVCREANIFVKVEPVNNFRNW